jgi:hypothetical protein
MAAKTLPGHHLCRVDSPLNVTGLMKQKDRQVLTVIWLILQQLRCLEHKHQWGKLIKRKAEGKKEWNPYEMSLVWECLSLQFFIIWNLQHGIILYKQNGCAVMIYGRSKLWTLCFEPCKVTHYSTINMSWNSQSMWIGVCQVQEENTALNLVTVFAP